MQKRFAFLFLFIVVLICCTFSGISAQDFSGHTGSTSNTSHTSHTGNTNHINRPNDTSHTAQALQDNKIKSRLLDSVKVQSHRSEGTKSNNKFSVGTNIIKFSEERLNSMKMGSLAEFIQQENAAYIKEYGRGMSAYISIRGSSSSHTTVAWNGMNLAVPTLGQADFSHIPLYLFDSMELHVGGNSSLYGDGSIGGSLQLTTAPNWKRGVHGDMLISGGSFGSLFTGGTLRYSDGKLETRSSLLRSSAENNYSFINNTKLGKPKEYLNNAAGENFGLLQEVFRKFRDSSILSATILYLDFDKEIQPSVSLNDIPENYRSIYDNNLKLNLGYNGSEGDLSFGARISYAYDKQLYEDDVIAANRLSLSTDVEYKFKNLTIKSGLFAERTIPQVNSYSDSVRENRVSAFLLARYSLNNKVLLSGGLRYAGVSDVKVPLMPSIEGRYNFFNNNNHNLSARGALSGNSKIPTMNDRYWGGEYLYLKSESSVTTEGGLDYSWFSGKWSVDLFGTLYKSRVKDWIRWLPAGTVWRPQNIPLVRTQGAEAGAKLSGVLPWVKVTLNFSLAYTDIRMIEGLRDEDPAIGEQLAYQPKLSWRAGLKLVRGRGALYTNLNYTGERTTIDLYDILQSYLITDVGASYDFKLAGCHFVANGVVKNITGEVYQNVKFYAMPGRNYQMSIQYKF